MNNGLTSDAIPVGIFAATNIDDLFLLAVLFADPKFRRRAIVFGQFAGIGALTILSVVAALLALTAPAELTALLGILPLALGLRNLWKLRQAKGDEEGAISLAASKAEARLHSQVLAVSAMTIATGGDNLGVCIPIFATNPSAIPNFAVVFTAMTGIWCVAGYLFTSNHLAGSLLRRWGRVLLPFVLIGIGLHILWGARRLIL